MNAGVQATINYCNWVVLTNFDHFRRCCVHFTENVVNTTHTDKKNNCFARALPVNCHTARDPNAKAKPGFSMILRIEEMMLMRRRKEEGDGTSG
jgi:hypothetical protein